MFGTAQRGRKATMEGIFIIFPPNIAAATNFSATTKRDCDSPNYRKNCE